MYFSEENKILGIIAVADTIKKKFKRGTIPFKRDGNSNCYDNRRQQENCKGNC